MDKDKKEEIRRLQDQIWITRISRVNAEARLKSKESFIQAMNIYYSCYTVFLSICLLIKQNSAFSLLSVIMTIVLMVSLLYFKSLRYTEQALAYRKTYTELQRLEFRLNHITELTDTSDIEQAYCDLMCQDENHISYDYYMALAHSSGEYRKEHWKGIVKVKYYWGRTLRFGVKLFLVLLPILLIVFVAVIYWGETHDCLQFVESMLYTAQT